MAYERALAMSPGDPVILRELADVYDSFGDTEMAALYRSQAGRGEIFQPTGGGGGERFRSSAVLRMGAFYDGNANSGLDSGSVTLGNWRVTLDGAEKIDGGGVYLGGQYDSENRISDGGAWHITLGGAFSARYAAGDGLGDIGRRFSQWYRASLGLRRRTERNVFDARLFGEISDYDFYDTVYVHGLETAFAHAVTPRLHLISTAAISGRRYVRSTGQSGTYGYIGEYARFFFGRDAHEFTLGGRLYMGDAKSARYTYDGWEASASFRFKLKNGYEILPGVTYAEESYDAPASALESDRRRDERIIWNLGVIKQLNKTKRLELNYQYTDNSSNSELHSYDRHFISMGAAWIF
jgi:hypothetical protein